MAVLISYVWFIFFDWLLHSDMLILIALFFQKPCHFLLICVNALFHFIGDEVQVVYRDGSDTTPVYENPSIYWNGFTGFRI